MNKQVANIFKTILIIGVVGLMACSEGAPPAPVSKVVKQKIVVPSAPVSQTIPNGSGVQAAADSETAVLPAQEDLAAAAPADVATVPPAVEKSEPEALTAKTPTLPVEETAEEGVDTATAQPETASGTATTDAVLTEADGDQVAAPVQTAGGYNPRGRINPFAPLFKDQGPTEVAVTSKGQRLKRNPQTPLEKVALSQLRLTAIIRSASLNRALVSDAAGKGYVVQPGTYIGLNSGKVVQIERDRIVIEEEYEDLAGEFKIHNSELKLQKPAGEF